jgi:hypothetical protein
VNSAASLAADLPVGRLTAPLSLLLAYTVPAGALWMLVGLLANLVPAGRIALILTVAYAAYYGLVETAGRPGLPAPGRSWQVPSRWVDAAPRWRRILIWGTFLGPGFATRNPYAGFGLLPLVVAAAGNLWLGAVLAALLGSVHGAGRAAALLRDTRRAADASYLSAIMRSIRWRTFDGLALLLVAGSATAAIATRR